MVTSCCYRYMPSGGSYREQESKVTPIRVHVDSLPRVVRLTAE